MSDVVRYVEMLGLPGAGKTTLLRRWSVVTGFLTLHQLIRRERLRSAAHHPRAGLVRLLPDSAKLRLLRGPEPDCYDVARFVVEHPALHDLAMAHTRRLTVEEERTDALWMLLDAWARWGYGQRVGAAEDGLLLDEGILQRLAFVLAAGSADAGSPRVPQDLAAHLPHLDGLIVLDVPLEVAVARVRQRGAEFQATHVMPAMEAVLSGTADVLRQAGVSVLVVDASRPREASLVQVREFLAHLPA